MMIRLFAFAAALTSILAIAAAIGLVAAPIGPQMASRAVAAAVAAQGSMMLLIAFANQLWYSASFWRWRGLTQNAADPARIRVALRLATVLAMLVAVLPIAVRRVGGWVPAGAEREEAISLFFSVMLLTEASWMLSIVLRGPRVLRKSPPELSQRLK